MDLTDLVESRLAGLKEKSFAELSQLSHYQDERIRDGNRYVTVAIWKDEVAPGELRVVVQAYRYLFLGIGRMEAQGIRITRSGVVRNLARSEIYEFC